MGRNSYIRNRIDAFPPYSRSVGAMLKSQVNVLAGCQDCGTFLEVRRSDLNAIVMSKGESYSLINRVARCKVVGCGGRVLFYATPDKRLPLRPLIFTDFCVQDYSVRKRPDGHFWLPARISKTKLNMMIDTGATNIVLGAQHAQALGINIDTLRYNVQASTANGRVNMAKLNLHSLSAGGTVLLNLPVAVTRANMPASVLGMDFLTRFPEFRIRGDVMEIRLEP